MANATVSPPMSPLDDGLPSSVYDGTHLTTKEFRELVMAPYRVKVHDTPIHHAMPESLLRLLGNGSQDLHRFDTQIKSLKRYSPDGGEPAPVEMSAQDVLPRLQQGSQLARCSKPLFDRHALPERTLEAAKGDYVLPIPHAFLASGFSKTAFTFRELSGLPNWMNCPSSAKKVVQEQGQRTSDIIHVPFLTFEHLHGQQHNRIEVANNQCAINGAWCMRALQLLHTRANPTATAPFPAQSFSCSIDSNLAIINHHWVDQDQQYCISPMCRFELNKQDHLRLLIAWIEAIEKWAIEEMLPAVRANLNALPEAMLTPPLTPQSFHGVPFTPANNTTRKQSLVMHSLKTTFDEVPWRSEGEKTTPVASAVSELNTCTSSTASWGSPTTTEVLPSIDSALRKQTTKGNGDGLDLLWKKSFSHAMSEIRELQNGLREARKETDGLRHTLEVEVNSLKQQLENMHNELSSTKEQMRSLEDDLAAAMLEVESPVDRYDSTNRQYETSMPQSLPATGSASTVIQMSHGLSASHTQWNDALSPQLSGNEWKTGDQDTINMNSINSINSIVRPVSEPRPSCPILRQSSSFSDRQNRPLSALHLDSPVSVDLHFERSPIYPTSPNAHINQQPQYQTQLPVHPTISNTTHKPSNQPIPTPPPAIKILDGALPSRTPVLILPYTPAPHKITFDITDNDDTNNSNNNNDTTTTTIKTTTFSSTNPPTTTINTTSKDGIFIVPPTPWLTKQHPSFLHTDLSAHSGYDVTPIDTGVTVDQNNDDSNRNEITSPLSVFEKALVSATSASTITPRLGYQKNTDLGLDGRKQPATVDSGGGGGVTRVKFDKKTLIRFGGLAVLASLVPSGMCWQGVLGQSVLFGLVVREVVGLLGVGVRVCRDGDGVKHGTTSS